LLNQGPILTDYLRTALWPDHLVFTYGEPVPIEFASALPFLALIALLLAVTAWAWVKRPALGFLGVAFFAVLAPTSTIVPIATEVGAERRMYLPLAAAIALVVLAIARARKGAPAIVVLLSILLIVLTARRNADYLTSEALWRSTVSSWPSAVAHRNLGTSLKLAGKREEALEQFRIAAQERPEVRRIVGQELFELGRFDEAIDELRYFLATADPAGEDARASRILVERSQFAAADARLQRGDFDRAAEMYRRYLAAKPDDPNALINLGIALLSRGEMPQAVQTLTRATEVDPSSQKAHLNLAVALAQHGAMADAAAHAERAVALAPNDTRARELLAQIQATQGRRPSPRR
jgi:tetratricopeptide (TPR) repeat protein